MMHDSSLRWLVAAVAISLGGSVGCGDDRPGVDPHGESWVQPAEPSAPSRASASGCSSTITPAGLVCSTCPDDAPGAAPECMAAECAVIDSCLQCTDPKGRVGIDCSIDPAQLQMGSWTTTPTGSYSPADCTFNWGAAAYSGTTCHYAGTNTCVVTGTPGDWQCLSCTYPDGSATSICGAGDLPDPMLGRPAALPAPGSCVSETDADGAIACSTCTGDDLSATRSCHYPGIIACDLTAIFDDDDGACTGLCTREDGSEVRLCNSDRGPRLFGLTEPVPPLSAVR
jgi:hypothetical protein